MCMSIYILYKYAYLHSYRSSRTGSLQHISTYIHTFLHICISIHIHIHIIVDHHTLVVCGTFLHTYTHFNISIYAYIHIHIYIIIHHRTLVLWSTFLRICVVSCNVHANYSVQQPFRQMSRSTKKLRCMCLQKIARHWSSKNNKFSAFVNCAADLSCLNIDKYTMNKY